MPSTRVAVVTGGNKGIGFCIVKFLCQQFDGDVILTGVDAPTYLALLPPNIDSPKGQFVWNDRTITPWDK
ncbi:carbonyl reductase [NADPH] 1-like isoform X2 [Amblyomma americanum]